jgi:hypothetical protein
MDDVSDVYVTAHHRRSQIGRNALGWSRYFALSFELTDTHDKQNADGETVTYSTW